jgi:uncharacterized membrane protein
VAGHETSPAPHNWFSPKPERLYLALAFIFGCAFLFLTPPFQVPDEEAHFRHAFALSEGHFVAKARGNDSGDDQPRGLTPFARAYAPLCAHPEEKTSAAAIVGQLSMRFDNDDREFCSFSGSAVYPPVPYLPQALGIFIARRFTSAVLICFTAGRVVNFLVAALLTFLAIRTTPIGKAGFIAVALLPMTLAQSASFSPDALTNALSFLFVAQVLACAFGPTERVSAAAVATAALLAAGVGVCKQAYYLLPLCYFLIPVQKLGSRRVYAAGFVVVMGATLVAAAGWGVITRNSYVPPDPRLGVAPGKHIVWILSHPLEFAQTLLRTGASLPLFFEEFVGWLGYTNLRLYGWLYIAELILLLFAFAADRELATKVSARQALLAVTVALLVAVTVLAVVDVAFNPVGASVISGVQGRYFIPIAPVVGIAIGWAGGLFARVWSTSPRVNLAIVGLAVPVLLSCTLFRVHHRFFVDTPADAARRLSFQGETLVKEGHRQEALEKFEEALQVDPNHLTSRLWLGQLFADTRPLEAMEQYLLGLQIDRESVEALNGLGTVLANREEYAEAIQYFKEANRLDPKAAYIKRNLESALLAQQQQEQVLREIGRICLTLARETGLTEVRNPGTPKEFTVMKPNRGRIVDTRGNSPFPGPVFLWRSPAPCGGEIVLSGPNGTPLDKSHPSQFYACSAKPLRTKRVFVFPPPIGARALEDQEVSWFYQTPTAELTEEESTKEMEYRKRLGLQFPLTELPADEKKAAK